MYKNVLRHVLHVARPHLPWLAAAAIFFILANAANMAVPIFLKTIVDEGLAGTFAKNAVLWAAGLLLVEQIIFRFFDYTMVRGQTDTFRDLYDYGYDGVMQHSYTFFTNTFAGSLIAKVKRFAHSFITIHDVLTFQLLSPAVRITFAIFVLLTQHWLLGAALLTWSIIYVTISVTLTRWQRKYDEAAAAQDTRTTAQLSDIISNVLTVKMFAKRRGEQRAFRKETDSLRAKIASSWYHAMIIWGCQAFLMVTLEIFAIYIIASGLSAGTMTAGTAILIQTYVLMILTQVWGIGRGVQKISKALSDMKELTDLIDQPVSVTDVTDTEPTRISQGDIRFEDVTFAYEDGETVLRGFHLHIRANEKVGLVGLSGSGKSTITKLLLRFLDVQEGRITIDGQNIRALKQEQLRQHITYVPQEPLLFHRSIKENIGYARKADNAEIKNAAKKAHAHEFIMQLPKGYQTLVGERGVKLSGGERQRVAIARALLKKAPIIVMDEATSSLDTISEQYIQDATEKLMQDKTAIVIAHRLSTVKRMDRIIVLHDGEIVEEGTHEQLLRRKGQYYQLYKRQQL